MKAHVRSFRDCDERVELPRLSSEMLTMGSLGIARNIHQPGWRWSTHVRPSVNTSWCEVHHVGYAVRGQLEITLSDGASLTVSQGDVFDIPAGHDGQVVGTEAFESIEWLGARVWLADMSTLRERVLATIVMTDIVGSTDMALALGERAWSEKIMAYEQAMRDVVETYHGRLVKFTGDGILAIFDGTARALRAVIALRLAAEDLGLSTRASVHTGDIEAADDDVHGIAVHEAARTLDLGSPGDVVVSSTTRLLASDQRLHLASMGLHSLRGFVGERELYRLHT